LIFYAVADIILFKLVSMGWQYRPMKLGTKYTIAVHGELIWSGYKLWERIIACTSLWLLFRGYGLQENDPLLGKWICRTE